MDDKSDRQRQLALYVAEHASTPERNALTSWAKHLLDVRESSLPAHLKASRALSATARSKVVWPAAKLIWGEIKRHAWDERGVKSRFGLGAAAVGALLFGGQSAGIAALGTAIGVPLWVVLGAGGTFAGMLIEELSRRGKE